MGIRHLKNIEGHYMLLTVDSTQRFSAANNLGPCCHGVYHLGRVVEKDDTHTHTISYNEPLPPPKKKN